MKTEEYAKIRSSWGMKTEEYARACTFVGRAGGGGGGRRLPKIWRKNTHLIGYSFISASHS